ncbi:hypothetical protein [Winogradskyella damuponensis]|uniref:Restriction endonuclease n=1 Tax=Winogradskyella damuponensis TaxID=943939 RepID=A0ABP8CIU7_9FLAO
MKDFFENSISKLKKERGIFHSEDDLKLSLGFIIKELYPELEIRLEKPININMTDIYGNKSIVRAPIDIIVYDKNGKTIPIELKYKTKKLETEFNGETYNLTNQGARDIGRYSFRKDIYRIEQYLTKEEKSDFGIIFILTNDENYINNNVGEKETFDKHFSCHQNSIIRKEYKGWNYSKIDAKKYEKKDNFWRYINQNKKHWTFTGAKTYKLELKDDYPIVWKEYSELNKSEFKFCLIKIKKHLN